ncbi:VUT family protein [Microvirga sp. BT688]|uniref:VUT family protein n=1 Tax=Microvirga sp. TaxID=1873136 RepID=UPI0016866E9B|nr:VUT family protein [Microvirga sp.]MBD2745843.1 VUT family protein [Microvirga sp.]
MKQNRIWGFASLAGFLLTIPLANYFVASIGTVCPPETPCLIPVAPGVMSPSGVVWAGLALILRDLVQRQIGVAWSTVGVLVGTGLSYLISPSLALASAIAFLISELLDLAVYTPLQRRGLILAVVASSAVGLMADSVAFLWVAFGSFDHLLGQVLGKAWMILISLPILYWLRNRDARELISSDRLPNGSATAHFQTS